MGYRYPFCFLEIAFWLPYTGEIWLLEMQLWFVCDLLSCSLAFSAVASSALILSVGRQEEHPACNS